MSHPYISIVIPTYCEADNLQELLQRITRTLRQREYEVIVVDDGSHDETCSIATGFKDRAVRVLKHPHRMGKTAALRTGFTSARGEVIVMIDGDLQFNPEEIPRLLEVVGNDYPVVTGWRDFSKYPFSRRIPSRIYNLLTSLFLSGNVHDHNSGFKVFKREVVEDLLKEVQWRKGLHRYLVAVTSVLGYRVTEVPVSLNDRKAGSSSFSGVSRLFFGLVLLLKLTYELRVLRRRARSGMQYKVTSSRRLGMNKLRSKEYWDTPYSDLYYAKHIMKLRSRWGRHRVKVVSDLIGSCENDVMLDLGCGIGTFTITSSRKNLYVVGVDLSARATRIAKNLLRKHGLSNAEIVRADVQYLPFRCRSISKIVCADLVEHLYSNQYHHLLLECKRVLCKGGRVGIYTPNPSHIFEKFKSYNFVLKKDESHVGLRSPQYLRESFKEHDFSIVKFYFRESHVLFFNIIEKTLMKIPFISKYFRRRICVLAEKV